MREPAATKLFTSILCTESDITNIIERAYVSQGSKKLVKYESKHNVEIITEIKSMFAVFRKQLERIKYHKIIESVFLPQLRSSFKCMVT